MNIVKKTLLFFFFLIEFVSAQEQRSFTFKKNEICYYFFSNMTPSLTLFSNHNAKFIVVNEQDNLLENSKRSKINDEKIARNDQTLYYYLKIPSLKNDQEYVKFLAEFVAETYNRDFFDRNSTSIDFRAIDAPFACEFIEELNMYFSSIIVSENSHLLSCGKSSIISKTEKVKWSTSITYEKITFIEAEQKRKDFRLINQLDRWQSKFFIALALGRSYINPNYTTDFDEETFVDVNEIKSIWSLTSGFMFTNKLGGIINLSLKTKKSQSTNFDGVNISGIGNGIGLIKFGIGARYMPFTKKRWSIYGDVHGGILHLSAKGGTGSGSLFGGVTRNINEKSESTHYISMVVGANYSVGKLVYLTSNIDYTFSKFDHDIGSVSGFTGYSINFGLGFTF